MYKASEQFYDAIYQQDIQARAYIKFGDVLIKDTDHLVSLVINDEIYDSEASQFIGTFVGKYGEVEINTQEYDLENQPIEVFVGVTLASGNVEYIPYGTFICYEVSKPKKEIKTKIKIIDKKVLFNETADLSIINYPITHNNILKAVCTKLGIIYKETEFPNKDSIVKAEVFFGYNATYSDIVKAVAQAAGGWAKINRDDELEICWVGKNAFQIGINNYFELDTSSSYGPINSLVLGRSPQNDNIYLKDDESIQKHGLTELQIINNPLVDDSREVSIVPIFQRLNGFTYVPLECKAQGNPCFEAGDQLEITDINDNVYRTYLLNHRLDFTGGMHSTISTPALTKTEIEYASAKSIEKSILETELKVDKVKGEIISRVEKVDKKVDNIQIGGRNILLNSSFRENSINWNNTPTDFLVKDKELCAHINHSEFGKTIYINQDINGKLKENTEYTMSGWVKTENIVLGTTNPSICFYHYGYYDNNGTSTWYGYGTKQFTVNKGTGKWERVVWTFRTDSKLNNAISNFMSVYTRDITGDVYFYNLKLELGNKVTDWTPAPEDTDTTISNVIKQTAESLDIAISEVNRENGEIRSDINDLTINLQGLENKLVSTGGNNLIEDSMGMFGGRFGSSENVWVGTYAVDRSQDVKNRNIYGYALMLMKSPLEQQKTVPNGIYTVSFEYCKHLNLAAVSVVINGETIALSNNEYTKVEKTFEVNANELSIKFISDADQACTICNLMANQGSSAAIWSLAPGESWGDYVKIGRGIEIGSEASDVTFNANADIIGFKNKSGDYVAVFTDTGADMKEIRIQNKARIVGLLHQRINGQTVVNQVGVD